MALARALAIEPRVLLLDEPLAALDARAKLHIRAELRRHLASFHGARLLVTHDPVDALVLADRMVVLEDGCHPAGHHRRVARRPWSPYVAELVGVNLLTGTAAATAPSGWRAGPSWWWPTRSLVRGGGCPPQAVTVHRHQPDSSARTWACATVTDLAADHDRVRLQLAGPVPLVAEVTPAAVADLGLTPGAEVWVSMKAVDLAVYEH